MVVRTFFTKYKERNEVIILKKFIKNITAIIMSAAMLLTSSISLTAFAADGNAVESAQETSSVSYTYLEDHSIIDCTNRYKMNDGKFNFTIKVPAGTNLYNVQIEITRDYKGTRLFYDHLLYFTGGVWDTSLTLIESYDGSDYYELITNKFSNDGIGIKLFLPLNGITYMATDTANGSTTEGPGYWLSA